MIRKKRGRIVFAMRYQESESKSAQDLLASVGRRDGSISPETGRSLEHKSLLTLVTALTKVNFFAERTRHTPF